MTVADFSMKTSVDRLVEIYAGVVAKRAAGRGRSQPTWGDMVAVRSLIAHLYLRAAIRAMRLPTDQFHNFPMG
jgi:hypothetical protein